METTYTAQPVDEASAIGSLILIGIIVLAIFTWRIYNSLVRLNMNTEKAWSDITVQLKRRLDLVSTLVNTVQGYATHESELFENVTQARADTLNAKGVKDTAAAENQLEGTLKSLFAVSENYPQLRATENFQQLQQELVETENKIQASRGLYNGEVRDYNTKIKLFPNNIFAGWLGFKERDFFEVEDMASVEEPVDTDVRAK